MVLIVADDLGYGDLGSYGASWPANTPNLDRLAGEGVRFTEHYAAANTCSPSRAALLTGRYPPRTGVNAVLFHDSPDGLPLEEVTIAELLRDAGYDTAMVGKWHLGNGADLMPLRQGFAEFYGVPHSNDQKNFFLWDGERRLPERVDQSALIRAYTDRAVAFVARERDRPFFLYLAHNAPHVPLHPGPGYVGRSHFSAYDNVVAELDASVGEVLAALAARGIDRETLVIFTSDNGPWLAMRELGGSAGDLRGGKTGIFEGGHRVPALARWPAHAPPGRAVGGLVTAMDWLPTIAELAGAPLPESRAIDGRSLVGALEGTGPREPTPFFYLKLRLPFGEQRHEIGAVREGRFKLVLAQRGFYPDFLEPLFRSELYHHGRALYDLEADPGETRDLADEHPEVVEALTRTIAAFEAELAPAPPVRTVALPADAGGWEKLAIGVAIGALIALLLVLGLGYTLVRVVRRALRRRRALS